MNEKLRDLRMHAKMTQEDLAELMNVSRQSVAKWENGESTPDLAMAGCLSAELEVPLGELVNTPMAGVQGDLRGKHVFGLVTVGDKGQIVIPVRARRVFHIRPGDQLMVLGDENRGLALLDARFVVKMAEEMNHDEE